MNCVEFERNLSEYLEGSHTPEQQAHVNSCPGCSGLLSDLNLISTQASALAAIEEPTQRLWSAIEAQLRKEGLIRLPQVEPVRAKWDFLTQWRTAWVVPVAAALALVAGLKLYHPFGAGDTVPFAKAPAITTPNQVNAASHVPASVSDEDQQLMSTVAARVPAQQARYRADLDDANAFIRDAEQSMKDDPNDLYTQQMLINAYAQKQMLYELAVDRSGQ